MWGRVAAPVSLWASDRFENWEELVVYIDGRQVLVLEILLVKVVAHERDLDVTKLRAVVLGLAADRAAEAAFATAGRSMILESE